MSGPGGQAILPGVAEARKARVVRATRAPRKELRLRRGHALLLVGAETGAHELDVRLAVLQPGTPPGPLHRHPGIEHAYYVVSGRARVRVDGTDHLLGAGDALFLPPGIVHGATNAGRTILHLLEIYSSSTVDFVEATAESPAK